MQTDLYDKWFKEFFSSSVIRGQLKESVELLKKSKRVFFLGNGGSNSISSHMMQDYAKIGGFQTFTFSDPSLITCFSNDYGFENAMKEWLGIHFTAGDVLIAVSSSGESKNILNASEYALQKGGKLITLSGFDVANSLSSKGSINFHLPVRNYGVVECFHQVILHIILDSLNEN